MLQKVSKLQAEKMIDKLNIHEIKPQAEGILLLHLKESEKQIKFGMLKTYLNLLKMRFYLKTLN